MSAEYVDGLDELLYMVFEQECRAEAAAYRTAAESTAEMMTASGADLTPEVFFTVMMKERLRLMDEEASTPTDLQAMALKVLEAKEGREVAVTVLTHLLGVAGQSAYHNSSSSIAAECYPHAF